MKVADGRSRLECMRRPSQRTRWYRIVFRGESDVLASAFLDMTPEFEGGNTALVGEIIDDAHLHGILSRAQSLGFELVCLTPVPPESNRDD